IRRRLWTRPDRGPGWQSPRLHGAKLVLSGGVAEPRRGYAPLARPVRRRSELRGLGLHRHLGHVDFAGSTAAGLGSRVRDRQEQAKRALKETSFSALLLGGSSVRAEPRVQSRACRAARATQVGSGLGVLAVDLGSSGGW